MKKYILACQWGYTGMITKNKKSVSLLHMELLCNNIVVTL